jgi:hypothetical protein
MNAHCSAAGRACPVGRWIAILTGDTDAGATATAPILASLHATGVGIAIAVRLAGGESGLPSDRSADVGSDGRRRAGRQLRAAYGGPMSAPVPGSA